MKKNKLKFMLFAISFLVMMITLSRNNIFAAGTVSISSTNISVDVGSPASVTITTNSCAGRFEITSTNSKIFESTSVWIDGSYTLQLSTATPGTATITIKAIDVSDTDLADVEYSKDVAVTVKEKAVTPPNNNNDNNNQNNGGSNNNNNSSNSNNNTTTVTKSGNAYLKSLQVNYEGLTPNFNRNKTTYTLSVGENVDSIKVTARAEHSGARVVVSGNTNLKDGDNNVYITVTAENGTKRTYTIVVTKSADPDKSNSYLENLIVENAKLSPEFSKEIFEYDCGTVGMDVNTLKILTFPEIEEAKVEITGNDELVVGENNIVIKVTSVDGSTTKEYKIKVVKDETVDALSNSDEDIKLVDEENDPSKLDTIIEVIKNNALVIIMYIFIIVEFIQIVYLYRKQNKKENNFDGDKNKKIDTEKTVRSRSGAINTELPVEQDLPEEVVNHEEIDNTYDEPKVELKLDLNKLNNENSEEDNTIEDEEDVESKYEEYLKDINNEENKIELNLNFDDDKKDKE